MHATCAMQNAADSRGARLVLGAQVNLSDVSHSLPQQSLTSTPTGRHFSLRAVKRDLRWPLTPALQRTVPVPCNAWRHLGASFSYE